MRHIILTFLLTMISGLSELSVRAYLDSSFLVRGEITTLTIETNGRVTTLPKALLESEDYKVEEDRAYTSRTGNTLKYNYEFLLSSFHLGAHTIPSIELNFNGETHKTNPVEFEVKPSSALEFKQVKVGDKEISYAVGMFLPERELYLGETVRSELKIYLPHDPTHFTIVDYGVPEQKRDGISAWRFQSDRKRATPFLLPNGPSVAVTYKSSAHAIKTGTVSLGPGDIRPVFRCIVTENGFPSYFNQPTHLPIAKIERKSLPLPSGAPTSFKGAVGEFSLDVEIDNQVRNSPSDPISVNLSISGTGNLDKLEPPVPLSSEGDWKLYPATKIQRDGERRYLSGTVGFNQILRPTSSQKDLPAFELSYFNPISKKYITKKSPPIPLLIQTSANPALQNTQPQDTKGLSAAPEGKVITKQVGQKEEFITPMPEENMSDVLGLISPLSTTSTIGTTIWKYWQLLPALLSILLGIKAFNKYLLPRLKPSEETLKIRKALHELKKTKETVPFLKKASQFSHNFLSHEEYSDLQEEVKTKRDEVCYQPNGKTASKENGLREALLKKLTQASKTIIPLVLLTLILPTSLKAQSSNMEATSQEILLTEAYEAGKNEDYSAALFNYLSAYPEENFPTTIQYNIGTCYAKLKEPGQAMLAYRRVLIKEPNHKEALQNIRYLERVYGSNVIHRTGIGKILSNYSLSFFKTLLFLLIWLLVISSLLLAVLQKRKARSLSWLTLAVSAFLLPLSICAIVFYPNDGRFCPKEKLAVITSPKTTVARTNASSTSNQVIKAPPGSIGKVIQQRGYWVYLEFANETRGWVNIKDLSMLLPHSSFTNISPVESPTDL